MSDLRVGFRHRGLDGQVWVRVGTTDPERFGSSPGSRGLTWCRAEVAHPAEGYAARFGWVQLVRSTDNRSGGAAFEMDPLEILGDTGHPFCYFGVTPILFDAPGRDDRRDLDWLAHSFLTRIVRGDPPAVEALCGFSWGFVVRGGSATTTSPAVLARAHWDSHLPVLRVEHPAWAFAEGFAAG
jgi:hypothetical protein